MAIHSDEQLDARVKEAGALLQEIQNYVGRDFSKPAKVRFPRGFIRTAKQGRARLQFLEPSHFKANISYALMLSDVQHWLLARTDLSGTAREMVIKLQIFLLGTVVESLTKIYLKGSCGGNYKKRTAFLLAKTLITPELKAELDWLWDMRNLMHLFQVEEHEWLTNDYSISNHNRAAAAFKSLVDSLNGA